MSASPVRIGGSTAIQTITNFTFVSIPPMAGVSLGSSTPSELIMWPGPVQGYVLQQSSDLTSSNWSNATNPVVLTNNLNEVTVPAVSNNVYYRLFLPLTNVNNGPF